MMFKVRGDTGIKLALLISLMLMLPSPLAMASVNLLGDWVWWL